MFLELLLLALYGQCITLAGSYRMGSLALPWAHVSIVVPLIHLSNYDLQCWLRQRVLPVQERGSFVKIWL